MDQLTFDDIALNSAIFNDLNQAIVEKTLEFHKAHPEAYELFKKFAREAQLRRKRFGGNAIIQRMRWETLWNHDGDEFKINNNWAPVFTRMLIHEDPAFANFFEIRRTPGTVYDNED